MHRPGGSAPQEHLSAACGQGACGTRLATARGAGQHQNLGLVSALLQVAHLYCPACARALCEDCVPEHEEHPTLSLEQGLQQQRSRLQGALSSVQSR